MLTSRRQKNHGHKRRLNLVRSLHHSKADFNAVIGDHGRALIHEAVVDGDVESIKAMLPVSRGVDARMPQRSSRLHRLLGNFEVAYDRC